MCVFRCRPEEHLLRARKNATTFNFTLTYYKCASEPQFMPTLGDGFRGAFDMHSGERGSGNGRNGSCSGGARVKVEARRSERERLLAAKASVISV